MDTRRNQVQVKLCVQRADSRRGVIDPSFRGEIEVILCNKSNDPVSCEAGNRIAQIVFSTYAKPSIVEIGSRDEFSASARGSKGFGSTGGAPCAPMVMPFEEDEDWENASQYSDSRECCAFAPDESATQQNDPFEVGGVI